MKLLTKGDKAPIFRLTDKNGVFHSPLNIKAKYKVVYFYPKDNTSGCTIEAKDFSRLLTRFENINSLVIGISGGDDKTKAKFCAKHRLKLILLSDPDFKVSSQYGVYGIKKFMGKSFKGISRVTYVIDESGIVIKVFPKVKATGHAEEVLEWLQQQL